MKARRLWGAAPWGPVTVTVAVVLENPSASLAPGARCSETVGDTSSTAAVVTAAGVGVESVAVSVTAPGECPAVNVAV